MIRHWVYGQWCLANGQKLLRSMFAESQIRFHFIPISFQNFNICITPPLSQLFTSDCAMCNCNVGSCNDTQLSPERARPCKMSPVITRSAITEVRFCLPLPNISPNCPSAISNHNTLLLFPNPLPVISHPLSIPSAPPVTSDQRRHGVITP